MVKLYHGVIRHHMETKYGQNRNVLRHGQNRRRRLVELSLFFPFSGYKSLSTRLG